MHVCPEGPLSAPCSLYLRTGPSEELKIGPGLRTTKTDDVLLFIVGLPGSTLVLYHLRGVAVAQHDPDARGQAPSPGPLVRPFCVTVFSCASALQSSGGDANLAGVVF